eukprot:2984-Heterococcus_DN1.PRE.7
MCHDAVYTIHSSGAYANMACLAIPCCRMNLASQQLALEMSMTEEPATTTAATPTPAAAPATATTTTAAAAPAATGGEFLDPSFVNQLLGQLPGVDANDPRILAALAAQSKDSDAAKKPEEKKEDKNRSSGTAACSTTAISTGAADATAVADSHYAKLCINKPTPSKMKTLLHCYTMIFESNKMIAHELLCAHTAFDNWQQRCKALPHVRCDCCTQLLQVDTTASVMCTTAA